jgi:hypothetical protein
VESSGECVHCVGRGARPSIRLGTAMPARSQSVGARSMFEMSSLSTVPGAIIGPRAKKGTRTAHHGIRTERSCSARDSHPSTAAWLARSGQSDARVSPLSTAREE